MKKPKYIYEMGSCDQLPGILNTGDENLWQGQEKAKRNGEGRDDKTSEES